MKTVEVPAISPTVLIPVLTIFLTVASLSEALIFSVTPLI